MCDSTQEELHVNTHNKDTLALPACSESLTQQQELPVVAIQSQEFTAEVLDV